MICIFCSVLWLVRKTFVVGLYAHLIQLAYNRSNQGDRGGGIWSCYKTAYTFAKERSINLQFNDTKPTTQNIVMRLLFIRVTYSWIMVAVSPICYDWSRPTVGDCGRLTTSARHPIVVSFDEMVPRRRCQLPWNYTRQLRHFVWHDVVVNWRHRWCWHLVWRHMIQFLL